MKKAQDTEVLAETSKIEYKLRTKLGASQQTQEVNEDDSIMSFDNLSAYTKIARRGFSRPETNSSSRHL